MPYSSQDGIPVSWRGKVTLEADPARVISSKNGKYFYHQCGSEVLGYARGALLPQFKHGDCPYFCDNCKTVVPAATIMALKLGKEYDE